MTTPLSIDRAHAALLMMDFQERIVAGYATDQAGLLARAGRLLDAARRVRLSVIHVAVGFRRGYPEVNARNAVFGQIPGTDRFSPDDAQAAIHADLAPRPDEPIVTKRRVGAFSGTDLDILLRARGIDTLLLAGISTSGVVLSTARHAADADYRLIVVGDCCADRDDEVHRVLLNKIFPFQASVAASDAVIAALA